jgi:acyl carrier protein
MEIKETIRDILVKVLKVRPEEIQDDVRLYDGLGVDSTEMVEVIILLGKTFGTEITPREVNKFSTLNDIENVIQTKIIQTKVSNADNRLESAY